MNQLVTLMFCGPHHTDAWSPMYHRVAHAASVARETCSPLLIVGDAFNGRAVEHFAEYARQNGIHNVIGAFDPGERTLTDAQAGLRTLRDRADLANVTGILVVTDDWHYHRAAHMLVGEARKIVPGRALHVHDRSTDIGPRPPHWVVEGEAKGIADYLSGRPYVPFGGPFGKPRHPLAASRDL
ncbi:hypothetical protein EBS80_00905 [bacterium]|nr:hypothetical protein [bacterium]